MGWLVSFLTSGVVGTVANAIVSVINKAKDVTIAGYQAGATMVSAQSQYMTAVLGHPLSPPSLMCYFLAFRYGKIWCYDPIISYWITGHAGYTDRLYGDTATAALIVLTGMFSAGIFKLIKG